MYKRQAQYRPCKIKKDAFKDVVDWVEQYRAYWEESFDRLGEYLKTVSHEYEENEGLDKDDKEKG